MRITKKTLQRQQQHLRRHYPNNNVAAIMRTMACVLVCLCLLVQGLLLLRIRLSNEEPATAAADVTTAAKTATNNRTSTTVTTNSDFAYAWLLSGIDPKKPQLYRGMLYTVVLAMTQLRASNSQADFVVLVQCKKTAKDCLPENEVQFSHGPFYLQHKTVVASATEVPTTVNQVHSTNDYWWYLLRQTVPHAVTDPLQSSAATPLGDQDFPKLTDMIRSGQRRIQQQQLEQQTQ
jgi:hypothetical protein